MASNAANGSKGLSANEKIQRFAAPSRPLSPLPSHALFNDKTRCFVYGLQPKAVQGMLDFDFICKRKTPSVAGIIYTFGGQFVSKMYWGTSETLLPVYQQVDKAFSKHPDVDTVVNFASSRSVYSSTLELMEFSHIKTIAIIAEGVPERVSLFSPTNTHGNGARFLSLMPRRRNSLKSDMLTRSAPLARS